MPAPASKKKGRKWFGPIRLLSQSPSHPKRPHGEKKGNIESPALEGKRAPFSFTLSAVDTKKEGKDKKKKRRTCGLHFLNIQLVIFPKSLEEKGKKNPSLPALKKTNASIPLSNVNAVKSEKERERGGRRDVRF